MTTYTTASGEAYIDLTSGDDAAAGTEVAPWKTLTNITSEANIYFKRGSSGNIGAEARKVLTNISGMAWSAYGSGDLPVIQNYKETASGNWLEVDSTDGFTPNPGSNIWRYDVGGASNAGVDFINFGSLGTVSARVPHWDIFLGDREKPSLGLGTDVMDSNGDWTKVVFADCADFTTQSNYLYVYATSNPNTYYGGPVFYQVRSLGPVINLNDCPDFDASQLKFQYCADVFRLQNSVVDTFFDGIRLHDIELNHVASFMRAGFNSTGYLRDFKFYNITGSHCYITANNMFGNIKDGEIYNWNITDIGETESVGGFYFATLIALAGEEVKVYNNTLDGMRYANWWRFDGAALYADTEAQYIWFNKNLIKNSFKAMHDNSGGQLNKFIGNVADDCQVLFQGSDSLTNGNANCGIYYNTAVNCGNTDHYANPNDLAVINFNNASNIGSVFDCQGNIVDITDNAVCPTAIKDGLSAQVTEDYNNVYGYTNAIVDAAGDPLSLGSNSITTDPDVSTDYSLNVGSGAIGAMLPVTLDAFFVDIHNNPLGDDIGASQFVSSEAYWNTDSSFF